MVVDDEKDIAESLTEILILHGYDAQAFENGKSAIESARQRCPDVVISDVIMPVINGVETVIAIQELCPRAQVLLLSGQAATSDILKEARESGHDFQLVGKPVHPYVLLKKLSTLA